MYPVLHVHTPYLQELASWVPVHCQSYEHELSTVIFPLKDEKQNDSIKHIQNVPFMKIALRKNNVYTSKEQLT